MIIDNRKKQLFTCGTIISNVLYTNDDRICANIPIHGCYNKMQKYFSGDGFGSFEKFCDYIENDAIDYNPLKAVDKKTGLHLTPLITEEHEESIHLYIEQLRYSFYRHITSRSYKNIESVNMETHTVVNEEGESVHESYFLQDEEYDETLKIEMYRKKLPYLLINLHNKGKCYGISTLSCIRAAMLDKTIRRFKFSNMKKYGIWKMDYSGECTQLLESNNGHFQKYFQKWLEGFKKDITYYDLEEFMYICNKVNIDFLNLDPKKYGQKFIDKLNCCYLTPDKELTARNIAAIADKNCLYDNKSLEYLDISYIADYIEDCLEIGESDNLNITIDNFMNSFISQQGLFNETVYNNLLKHEIVFSKPDFDEKGILTDKYDYIKILSVSKLMNDDYFLNKTAIYHKSGYLILVYGTSDTMIYLPPCLINEYIYADMSGIDKSVISFSYNRKKLKWGEWLLLHI